MTIRTLLCLSMLAVLASFAVPGAARTIETTPEPDDGLVLEGEVVSVERIEREDTHSVRFRIALRLRFANTGAAPVIVYTEEPWLGGVTIARSVEAETTYDYLLDYSAWPSFWGKTEQETLRAKLDRAEPPEGVVRVIAPGEAWTRDDVVTVGFPRKADSSSNPTLPWDVVRKLPALVLRVTFEMWPVNAEIPRVEERYFGKKLAERWRASGQLRLDTLESQPIRLELPPEERADGEGAPAWGRELSVAPSDASDPEQAAEWWYNFPDSPLRFGFERIIRAPDFCLSATGSKKIVAYTTGCISLDGPRPRVVARWEPTKRRLAPGATVGSGRLASNFDVYRCDGPNVRVAVLEVRFADGTAWRADADGM